jgi:hypothetical protein
MKPTKSIKMRNQQKLLGVGILLIGLFAVLGVGWFLYNYYRTPEAQVSIKKQERQKISERGSVKRFNVAPRKTKKPENKKLLALKALPRQENITFQLMEGKWIAMTVEGVVLLKLSTDKTYKLVFINEGNNGQRIYSEGVFTQQGDILRFKPDRRIKPPTHIRGNRIFSRKLTASPFPVMVSKQGNNIIWKRPSVEAARQLRISVPNEHAVLNKVEEQIVVWKRMK